MFRRLCALTLPLLLLCGCAADERPAPETAAELYAGAELSGEVTATVFGSYPAEYGLSYHCTQGGSARIEVTSPEDVAGIALTVEDGGATVRYDGAALETLLPFYAGYAPADAVPALFDALAAGMPENWGTERDGDAELVTLAWTEELGTAEGLRRIRLRAGDLSPVDAELFIDDSLLVRLRFGNFSRKPAQPLA